MTVCRLSVPPFPIQQWNKLMLAIHEFLNCQLWLFKEFGKIGSDISCVEAGSNTSTVALRVIEGDKKGSLESERVKCGHECYGTRTWKRLHWRGPAAIVNDTPVFSSKKAVHINKPATGWLIVGRKIRLRFRLSIRHTGFLSLRQRSTQSIITLWEPICSIF
jgi:hypothetical protein